MNAPKSVLLINGSPRCEKSNSRAIAKNLTDKLDKKGVKSSEATVVRLINTAQGRKKLLDLVDAADILVLATPLYVDSIPAFTIKAMELICSHRKATSQPRRSMLVPVINCGFPEIEHMKIAVQIMQHFALESNLEWGGEVIVGMGAALNGELSDENKMTRNLIKGLGLASETLVQGQVISDEAKALIVKPFLPLFVSKPMLRWFGSRVWNKQAKQNGAQDKMRAKPYAP